MPRRPDRVSRTSHGHDSGQVKLTGLVLAYSLSMNPWSHVLTLYLRTSFMASSRPRSPRPSPSGRHKASSRTKSSGLRALTRAFWTRPCLFGSSSPTARDGTASSASRMNGMIRALTASMSWLGQPGFRGSGEQKTEKDAYMLDLVGPVQGLDSVCSVHVGFAGVKKDGRRRPWSHSSVLTFASGSGSATGRSHAHGPHISPRPSGGCGTMSIVDPTDSRAGRPLRPQTGVRPQSTRVGLFRGFDSSFSIRNICQR